MTIASHLHTLACPTLCWSQGAGAGGGLNFPVLPPSPSSIQLLLVTMTGGYCPGVGRGGVGWSDYVDHTAHVHVHILFIVVRQHQLMRQYTVVPN